MAPDPRVHVGAAAIVERWVHDPTYINRQQLLMLRRVGNTGYAADEYDTWSVPGGWVEHGENPFQTIVREVLEETGVDVQPQKQLGWVTCPSHVKDITIITLFIECKAILPDAWPRVCEPDKCVDVQWMPVRSVFDGRPLFAPLAAWLSQ